jgi:dipeptidyl aminopeptidase/acylaminoacyl peptidase
MMTRICAGIGDLDALLQDTHKFESRYADILVGPYPEMKHVYDERAPIKHIEQLSCPLLLLQGLDDRVVPPNQATTMYQAALDNGVPAALILFEGEGHGFRKAESIQRALNAELNFYGMIFGFEPDVREEVPLHTKPASTGCI